MLIERNKIEERQGKFDNFKTIMKKLSVLFPIILSCCFSGAQQEPGQFLQVLPQDLCYADDHVFTGDRMSENLMPLIDETSHAAKTILHHQDGIITMPEDQSCLPDGITFTSQAQIDGFQSQYPGCTRIEGNVTISGIDITNLDGLSGLTSMDGEIFIWECDSLRALNGLEHLTHLGSLQIYNAGSLKNLEALNKVTYIGGNLRLISLDSLEDLSGLRYLRSIDRDLIINDLPIETLSGLDALESVGILGDYHQQGFEFEVFQNPSLASLQGLSNLNYVYGHISIRENPELRDLTGLENIDPDLVTSLIISDNHQLSGCAIEGICKMLDIDTIDAYLGNNATGCNSNDEVLAECSIIDAVRVDHEDRISVYPNPVNGLLFISAGNGIRIDEVAIYNLTGRKVMSVRSPEQAMDISSLVHGIYFIEIVSDRSGA